MSFRIAASVFLEIKNAVGICRKAFLSIKLSQNKIQDFKVWNSYCLSFIFLLPCCNDCDRCWNCRGKRPSLKYRLHERYAFNADGFVSSFSEISTHAVFIIIPAFSIFSGKTIQTKCILYICCQWATNLSSFYCF